LVPYLIKMSDRANSPAGEFAAVRASAALTAGGSSSRSDLKNFENVLNVQEALAREQARQSLARIASRHIVALSLEQVRSQLRLSMAACKTAGIPLSDESGWILYRLLADEFESATVLENLTQAELDAMVARVVTSTLQLIEMWKTARGSCSQDNGRLRAPPGAAFGGPGPASTPFEARPPAPTAGGRARESSPTQSFASAATAMPAAKRAQVVVSDVAAAAAAAADAKLVTIGDNWSHDVKIFFP
jgi:hypothetical protein